MVKEVTQETKLVYSAYLSAQTGNKVYLKPENMQFTGAYKVRGAYYKLSTLTDEERKTGMFTMKRAHALMNWRKRMGILLFILSMIWRWLPVREP